MEKKVNYHWCWRQPYSSVARVFISWIYYSRCETKWIRIRQTQERTIKNGKCHTFSLDARKEQDIKFIETIEQDVGPISVAVYNIGANIKYNILETTSQNTKVWEMAAFGAFLMGREVANTWFQEKKVLEFLQVQSSIRGKGFAAFAGAKHTNVLWPKAYKN